jgi:hypothetical protein
MTGDLGAHLQKLSNTLGKIQPQMMPYPAGDFVEDLRAKLTLDQPEQSAAIEWNGLVRQRMLKIDPQILTEAFVELLANADRHGRAKARLSLEPTVRMGRLNSTCAKPKTKFDGVTEDWGARPLQHIREERPLWPWSLPGSHYFRGA